MSQPVVLIAEKLAPSAIAELGPDVEVRHVDGADRSALLPALAEADAVMIRSATTIDAEALAAAPRLKVVARAGIGLDNVDVPAATARGVLVVNAPQSNIITAAEHALALLLAVARQIPAAHASVAAGEWKRSSFEGVEIADKTVGVVGLGRIGQLFAARIAAFGTTVIAYDPYLQPARAAALGVQLVDLATLLRRADIISIHLPRTPETLGLIGAAELATVKPNLLLVNAARGGLVDEQALADALTEGRVAGAGIDVYVKEPMAADNPLRTAPNIVLTPHLGASTREAQDKAGTAVARSVKLALRGDFVPDAVNVQAAGPVADELRPWIPLVTRLGEILTAVGGTVPAQVAVEVRGDLAAVDTSILQLAAVRGIFGPVITDAVTFVNAPALAAEHGVTLTGTATEETGDYRSQVTLRGAMPDGSVRSVSGTLSGERQVAKLIEINGRHFDLRAEGDLVLVAYADRPGVMGTVGALLGAAGVNILAAQISQEMSGQASIMVLRVDGLPDAALLERIGEAVQASAIRGIPAG
ncbi:phosphoglycerate dehydrogenase [Nakamurella endophytica]|uniref:D-3-phosphoglycerate dehydrogenase n=1 Tax=Nakamurella endophytica TaxID=1748367 RepID=A0A917SL25_9ACTN|nr:phosphoglycerate dehydrogenase [Nakamurella endophytica]GGL85029.1 D-3-phosphoglycerate dehydrogenase [Nakamurella endophytica]